MTTPIPLSESGQGPVSLSLHQDDVRPAPYALLKKLDTTAFQKLIDQTRSFGMPIATVLVYKYGDHYEIVSGINEYNAYIAAFPQRSIPVEYYFYKPAQAVRVAVELAQAKDSFSAIELAHTFRTVMKYFTWNKVSDLTKALGRKHPFVHNKLALLELPPKLQALIHSGELKEELGKHLCRQKLMPNEQLVYAQKAMQLNWSARQLYKAIHPDYKPKGADLLADKSGVSKDKVTRDLESYLSDKIQSPIKLALNKLPEQSGSLEISFSSLHELAGIIERIERKSDKPSLWKGQISFALHDKNHLADITDELSDRDEYY